MKKPSFKPIAMRCNQEQFERVRSKLSGWMFDYAIVSLEYPYLTNYLQHGNQIATCTDFYAKNNKERHELHETWNEKIFLEACGIEVEEPKEETFVISREQLENIVLTDDIRIVAQVKEWFPSAFVEDKKELFLEDGNWYNIHTKTTKYLLLYSDNKNELYAGFMNGNWGDDWWCSKDCNQKLAVLATQEEVEEALKAEAVKRYKNSSCVPLNKHAMRGYNNHYEELCFEKFCFFKDDELWAGFGKWNAVIFNNGKWAEIIPTITKEEAEQKLKCKII